MDSKDWRSKMRSMVADAIGCNSEAGDRYAMTMLSLALSPRGEFAENYMREFARENMPPATDAKRPRTPNDDEPVAKRAKVARMHALVVISRVVDSAGALVKKKIPQLNGYPRVSCYLITNCSERDSEKLDSDIEDARGRLFGKVLYRKGNRDRYAGVATSIDAVRLISGNRADFFSLDALSVLQGGKSPCMGKIEFRDFALPQKTFGTVEDLESFVYSMNEASSRWRRDFLIEKYSQPRPYVTKSRWRAVYCTQIVIYDTKLESVSVLYVEAGRDSNTWTDPLNGYVFQQFDSALEAMHCFLLPFKTMLGDRFQFQFYSRIAVPQSSVATVYMLADPWAFRCKATGGRLIKINEPKSLPKEFAIDKTLLITMWYMKKSELEGRLLKFVRDPSYLLDIHKTEPNKVFF